MDCHKIKPHKGGFLTLARPRYLFGGLRPRETPTQSNPPLKRRVLFSWVRVVSQEPWNFKKLSPTSAEQTQKRKQQQLEVKVHGVSSSRAQFLASSRECQVRRRPGRDSRTVMTPFMRANNYLARNFATLEPSELWLPFTGPSVFPLS